MVLLVYKTLNNEFKYRFKKDNKCVYLIGSTNHYGWSLVSVQKLYKFRFYDYFKYLDDINSKYKIRKRLAKALNFLKENYCNILVIILVVYIIFFK